MKYNTMPVLSKTSVISIPDDEQITIEAASPIERCFLMDFSEKAIIAGGFLRDTLLDKPTKDFDFFIQDYPELLGELDKLGFESLNDPAYPVSEEESDGRGIVDVYNYGRFDVIVLKGDPVEHIIDAFPIALSKVWADFDMLGNVLNIMAAHDCLQSIGSRTISVCTGPLVVPKTANIYAERIHEKYPEYALKLVPVEEVPLETFGSL